VDNNIRPLSHDEPQTDIDYVQIRLGACHDVWHVVTGYGVDKIGEEELQAFTYGACGGGNTSLVVIAYGMVQAVSQGDARGYVAKVRAAHLRGRASRAMLTFLWEEHWSQPLVALRERLCPPH
jgi:ubiquinone biosynthesis protein Coq4